MRFLSERDNDLRISLNDMRTCIASFGVFATVFLFFVYCDTLEEEILGRCDRLAMHPLEKLLYCDQVDWPQSSGPPCGGGSPPPFCSAIRQRVMDNEGYPKTPLSGADGNCAARNWVIPDMHNDSSEKA